MKTWIALLQAFYTTRPPSDFDFAQLSTYAPKHAYMAQGSKLIDVFNVDWSGGLFTQGHLDVMCESHV